MWLTNFEEAKRESSSSRKPILLQFEREGCGGCKRLYEYTYKDPKVDAELNQWFVLLRADILKDRGLRRDCAAYWTPSFYFLDHNGKSYFKFNGYLPPDDFRVVLRLGLTETLIPKGKYDEALAVLRADENSLFGTDMGAKIMLQKGIIIYLKNRDNKEFRETMEEITRHYPHALEARMYFWEK